MPRAAMSNQRLSIPVMEIVKALERESANTDTDPRWQAASALRQMDGWEGRTLMCAADTRPDEIVEAQAHQLDTK